MSTRTAESIAKVARKNPVSARTWWIAGLAGAAAAGVGLIAYIVTRPGTSLQVSIPPVLKSGDRYQFVMTAKAGTPTSGAPDKQAIQQFLDQMAPGEFKVEAATVSAQPPSLAVTFVVVGKDFPVSQVPANVEQNIAAQGVTSLVITDLGPISTSQLTPGHRYGLTLACPMPLPTPLPTDHASATAWLGIPGATVVSFKQTSPNSLAVEFDYAGTTVLPLPPIQASGATACTSKLSDMGVSP
jgi:hypothetical protein